MNLPTNFTATMTFDFVIALPSPLGNWLPMHADSLKASQSVLQSKKLRSTHGICKKIARSSDQHDS